jgi:uncharacterized Ntn-hydrolase superfamily protein
MTFSIVGCDIGAQEWGVAVASKFLAVGAVVPWAEAGAGAVATQALANTQYGPRGLVLLRGGASARETVDRLVESDPARAERQVGVVDARGRSATHTGDECLAWAGGRTGRGYAAQGNILAGPAVVDAMADSFEQSGGERLCDRLLRALAAGDAAGGDRRGRQSAAILLVSPGGGYGGLSDVAVDLRSDDHDDPVAELARLLQVHDALHGSTPDEAKLPLRGALADEVRELLACVGHEPEPGEDGIERALRSWVAAENLEERWWGEDRLDPVVLERLRVQAAAQGDAVT